MNLKHDEKYLAAIKMRDSGSSQAQIAERLVYRRAQYIGASRSTKPTNRNGVDMNIILLYKIIAIASAMGILVAFLMGNTMAAGWALVSTVSASGSIYLAKTANILKTPTQD